MKKLFTLILPWWIFLMLLGSATAYGQRVKIVSSKYQADYLVYKTSYKHQAELLVHVVGYKYQASNLQPVDSWGEWYFVENKHQADISIYFTESLHESNLTIFFVNHSAYSGWNKSLKRK